MKVKKAAIVFNGFIHDFAAGYWLSAIVAIAVLHGMHVRYTTVTDILNAVERLFFWQSVGAMVVIMATGAGRTFTYVDNYYGPDAEKVRRKMLIIKHVVLLAAFGAGYLAVWGKVFH